MRPTCEVDPYKTYKGHFDRRAQIDNVNAVKGTDLEIAKQGDRFEITASYSVRVPLFANVSACLDFEATSGK